MIPSLTTRLFNNNKNKNCDKQMMKTFNNTNASRWWRVPSNTMFLIVVLLIILTYLTPSLQAIYCWQCNSAVDKFCNEVPQGPMEDPERIDDCFKKMYKECPSENDKLNYTFCRKQVQTIDKETRVIRACGFIKAPQDCYWTKNPPVTTLVCQCEGDGCNGVFTNNPVMPLLTVALPILVVAFSFLRQP